MMGCNLLFCCFVIDRREKYFFSSSFVVSLHINFVFSFDSVQINSHKFVAVRFPSLALPLLLSVFTNSHKHTHTAEVFEIDARIERQSIEVMAFPHVDLSYFVFVFVRESYFVLLCFLELETNGFRSPIYNVMVVTIESSFEFQSSLYTPYGANVTTWQKNYENH